jgi:hypothetical protein
VTSAQLQAELVTGVGLLSRGAVIVRLMSRTQQVNYHLCIWIAPTVVPALETGCPSIAWARKEPPNMLATVFKRRKYIFGVSQGQNSS